MAVKRSGSVVGGADAAAATGGAGCSTTAAGSRGNTRSGRDNQDGFGGRRTAAGLLPLVFIAARLRISAVNGVGALLDTLSCVS